MKQVFLLVYILTYNLNLYSELLIKNFSFKDMLNEKINDASKQFIVNIDVNIDSKVKLFIDYYKPINNITGDNNVFKNIQRDIYSFNSILQGYKDIIIESNTIWNFFYLENKICPENSKFYKILNSKFNFFYSENLLNKETYIDFETLYVYLNYVRSLEANTCKDYLKSLNKLKNIRNSIKKVSFYNNKFFDYFKINLDYFDAIKEAVNDGSVNNYKLLDLRRVYENIYSTLSILDTYILNFLNIEIFKKLNIYTISLLNNFKNLDVEDVLKFNNREKSVILLNNTLFFNLNIRSLGSYRALFAEFMMELIYRYSEEDDVLWYSISGEEDIFYIKDFKLLSCKEQKARVVYNFLNPSANNFLNTKENEYLKLLFGASYIEESERKKYFNELPLTEDLSPSYANFRNLTRINGKVLWTAELLNKMIGLNTGAKHK